MDPRAKAALLLTQFAQKGISLTELLNALKHPEAALIKELCYGVVRFYYLLLNIANQLINKPFKEKDRDLYNLILIGIYQLLYMRLPPHAAVSNTVTATQGLGKPWAKNLVNALLRRLQREQATLLAQAAAIPTAHYAHPEWLLQAIQQAWPEHWPEIIAANNQYPPLTLRVNLNQLSRDDYLELLQQHNLPAQPTPYSNSGIILTKPVSVEKLPGFSQGLCSVQDESAQLAAHLLDLKPQQRVLELCAAPGGKTTHILEHQPHLATLIAVDKDKQRCQRITENLQRLKLSAKIIVADLLVDYGWWDQVPFDRILLDPPCSATGVIRRHPDIKILRQASDIPCLAQQQLTLLKRAWPLLKQNGLLVYATCSILPQENTEVIQQFLQQHPEAQAQDISAPWGLRQIVGRQILPDTNNMDGFYYACLKKC